MLEQRPVLATRACIASLSTPRAITTALHRGCPRPPQSGLAMQDWSNQPKAFSASFATLASLLVQLHWWREGGPKAETVHAATQDDDGALIREDVNSSIPAPRVWHPPATTSSAPTAVMECEKQEVEEGPPPWGLTACQVPVTRSMACRPEKAPTVAFKARATGGCQEGLWQTILAGMPADADGTRMIPYVIRPDKKHHR
ncbi:MAG: hypothetical protein FRX49_07940 [Trebouxia sp. A1-2]|nr:MAG: hypothetical protein FRX49_07940 [Trebouxia sp. A1-2]